MGRLRLVTLLVCGLALGAVVVAIAGAVYFAPPREYSAFRGVQVRGANDVPATTILPREGLVCAEGSTNPLITTCRATVGANPLVVTMARPAPDHPFAACTAAYGERSAPCRAGFAPYAMIDGAALGLVPADLAALRHAWSPAGWGEALWRRAILMLAALTGLGFAGLVLNAPLDRVLGRAVAALAAGLATFFHVAPFLGFALDALGYID